MMVMICPKCWGEKTFQPTGHEEIYRCPDCNGTASVSTRFHLVRDELGYSVWGNQANEPSCRLGHVDDDTALAVYWSIELAWHRSEDWAAGLVDPVPVPNPGQ